MRFLARFLRLCSAPSLSELARDGDIVRRAHALVGFYYALLPAAAYIYLMGPVSGVIFEPDWQVGWIRMTNWGYAEAHGVIGIAFCIVALAAALLYRYRAARIAAFLVITQVHGIESSVLSVDTSWLLHLYTSCILIFLPRARGSSADESRMTLLIVWTAQAAVTLAYTMAGTQKLLHALVQAAHGEVNAFSTYGFANQVANYVPDHAPALLAYYVISYPSISSLFYIALIFFQLGSWWVMVRPSLHRGWGIVIIAFHMGTFLTLSVAFVNYVLIISALFLMSPFVPRDMSWRRFLADMPFIGHVARRVRPDVFHN